MTAKNTIYLSLLSLLSLCCLILASACGGFGAPSKSSHKTSPGPSPVHSDSRQARAASAGESGGGNSARPSRSEALVDDSAPQERPGLGTRFGERRHSATSRRRFERASNRPFGQVALHYNNLAGIQQQSWYRGTSLRELRAQTSRGGISISLMDENGRLLRGGTDAGRTYVVGQDGQRYTMQIRNDTGGTYEVVSSVDGLDVIDGKPASLGKRGYIIGPYSTLTIDGFRTSESTVAAFRFGAVSQSYAARTTGDRNVGVIGFAFFAERGSRWTNDEIRRRETANPFPGGYARPPGIVH